MAHCAVPKISLRVDGHASLNQHQRQEALQRLANGESLVDVARTYGVDPTTIGRLQGPSQIGNVRFAYPGAVPIVQLGSTMMKTAFGLKPRPEFKIVGWRNKGNAPVQLTHGPQNKPPEQNLSEIEAPFNDQIPSFDELASMTRGEIERVKAFITRKVDRFRPSYGRRVIEVPRQSVFIGSTNSDAYLKDETGGRRFWPIRCGNIDLKAIERDRPQLWAEALDPMFAEDLVTSRMLGCFRDDPDAFSSASLKPSPRVAAFRSSGL